MFHYVCGACVSICASVHVCVLVPSALVPPHSLGAAGGCSAARAAIGRHTQQSSSALVRSIGVRSLAEAKLVAMPAKRLGAREPVFVYRLPRTIFRSQFVSVHTRSGLQPFSVSHNGSETHGLHEGHETDEGCTDPHEDRHG